MAQVAFSPAPLPATSAEPPGTALPITLHLQRGGPGALASQLAAQLRRGALEGQLPCGYVLPGSRTLAQQLGVGRGVVVEAYAELLADGTVHSEVGSGTRVAPGLRRAVGTGASWTPRWWPPTLAPLPSEAPPTLPLEFRLGAPCTALIDLRAWKAAWAQVSGVPPADYSDPAGEWALRSALSAFINRSRGLSASPEQMMITSGTAQSLSLLATTLPRGAVVAVEDPGYPLARQIFKQAGLDVQPCRVDDAGLVVSELHPRTTLVCVTPSHQYPLGVRMALPRRLALLTWAAEHGALIAEDDYDGEFRYDVSPLPALASLDAQHVVYLGTLSKVLTPTLRLGYLCAAPALLGALVQAKHYSDRAGTWATQQALSHFLLGGHLDKHLRRSAKHYAAQRAVLKDVLGPLSPHAVLGGIEAGLHVCLHLAAAPLSAAEVQRRLARRGVGVRTLREYAARPCAEALLLGYGSLTRLQLEQGARIIKAELEALI